jgi:hypothetical protein
MRRVRLCGCLFCCATVMSMGPWAASAHAQTCDPAAQEVVGSVTAKGSAPMDGELATVLTVVAGPFNGDWELGSGWGSITVVPPSFSVVPIQFKATSNNYLPTPLSPGATCEVDPITNCRSCNGGFGLDLYAKYGNISGTVTRLPKRELVAGALVYISASAPPRLTDANGFYSFARDLGPEYEARNWGVGVYGDGSGPGVGNYEIKAESYYPEQERVAVTTTSSENVVQDLEIRSTYVNGAEPGTRPPQCGPEPPPGGAGPKPPGPNPPQPGDAGEGGAAGQSCPRLPACAPGGAGRPVNVLNGNAYLDQVDASLPSVGGSCSSPGAITAATSAPARSASSTSGGSIRSRAGSPSLRTG